MGKKAQKAREETKRTLRATPLSPEEKTSLRASAAYEGSPYHKKEPNNFGLTPPTFPRADATLCDEAGITDKQVGFALFARAIDGGLVSASTTPDGFPKQMWVVAEDGRVFEAIYGGSRSGRYHGYPIRLRDPWYEEIKRAWKALHNV